MTGSGRHCSIIVCQVWGVQSSPYLIAAMFLILPPCPRALIALAVAIETGCMGLLPRPRRTVGGEKAGRPEPYTGGPGARAPACEGAASARRPGAAGRLRVCQLAGSLRRVRCAGLFGAADLGGGLVRAGAFTREAAGVAQAAPGAGLPLVTGALALGAPLAGIRFSAMESMARRAFSALWVSAVTWRRRALARP